MSRFQPRMSEKALREFSERTDKLRLGLEIRSRIFRKHFSSNVWRKAFAPYICRLKLEAHGFPNISRLPGKYWGTEGLPGVDLESTPKVTMREDLSILNELMDSVAHCKNTHYSKPK